MHIKRIMPLSVWILAGVTVSAFSPEGLVHRDLAEVSHCVRDRSGGVAVFDFSQGDILDGDVRWTCSGRDSMACVTFMHTRYNLLKGKGTTTPALVSEESRLKSIRFESPLSLSPVDSAVTFSASGYYCKTTPVRIDGTYSFTTGLCDVILTPGDTVSDVTRSTLTLRYKGEVGDETDDSVVADSLPTFVVSRSVFTVDGDLLPCAVIVDERIYDSDGVQIVNSVRCFADVMTVNRRERKSSGTPEDESGDASMSVHCSSGAIYVSAQGVPADGIVAVMDKGGNIYRSATLSAGGNTVIDVSGLPFGQYIVSVSSESGALTIKELVYIR